MAKKRDSKRTPVEIVEDLAPAYQGWKSNEKDKEKFRKEFFDSITDFLQSEGEQAEEIVTIKAPSEEVATELVGKRYPGWIFEDIRESPEEEGEYEVIIKENPAFQSYSLEYDGKIWQRQVRTGSTLIDDDRIREEDPELWEQISVLPMQDFLIELVTGVSSNKATPKDIEVYVQLACEKQGMKRSMKPLEEIDQELLPKVQEYLYEGKPSLTLPAPKKAEDNG